MSPQGQNLLVLLYLWGLVGPHTVVNTSTHTHTHTHTHSLCFLTIKVSYGWGAEKQIYSDRKKTDRQTDRPAWRLFRSVTLILKLLCLYVCVLVKVWSGLVQLWNQRECRSNSAGLILAQNHHNTESPYSTHTIQHLVLSCIILEWEYIWQSLFLVKF